MKINWRTKLSSRKFWALVVAVSTSVLGAFGTSEDMIVQITGIITSVGVCVVYILAEAYTDVNGKHKD